MNEREVRETGALGLTDPSEVGMNGGKKEPHCCALWVGG